MDRPNIDVTSSVTFGYDSSTDLPPPSTTSFVSTSSTTNAIPSILTKNSQGAFASSSPEKPFFKRPSSYGSPTKPIDTSNNKPIPSPAKSYEAPSYKKSTSFGSPAPTIKPQTFYSSPAKTTSSVAARWMAATQSTAVEKKEESSETSSESEPSTPSSEPVVVETTPPSAQPVVEEEVISTYDTEAENQVVQWIEAITHRKVPEFGPNLQSGKLLCIFFNTLLAISAADEAPIKIESASMAFKQLQNIKNFLNSCRAIGVADADCFEPTDLYELKNLSAVVSCLFALNQAIVKKYTEYPGPVLTHQEKTQPVATPSVATHTFNTMLRHTSSRGLPTRTNWQ
ncbi:hypothetical protein THRCLA_02858 [Thraustotheca clavata]|uniref:Calponin-homology (CH) domain-containing protein n=1 Tax=Thraustotheca clavata TaxID=74557 RepID=A0A1W0A3U2_9STRA|nr:hypothetical protein THRCLA_02858 [Thraustotheca clavata]